MGSAAAVLFFFGGRAPMLKLDRRQGSVTNAKTTVRREGGGICCKPFCTIFGNCFLFWCSFCSKKIKKTYSKLPRRRVYYRSYQAHAQKMHAGEEIYYKEFLPPKKTNNVVLGLTSEGITPGLNALAYSCA